MNDNRNGYIKIPRYIKLDKESEANFDINIDYCAIDVFQMGNRNIFQNKIEYFISKIGIAFIYIFLFSFIVILLPIIFVLLPNDIIDESIKKTVNILLKKEYLIMPFIISISLQVIASLKAPNKIHLNISDTGINITSNLTERGNVFIEKAIIEDIVTKPNYYKGNICSYDIILKCIKPLLLPQSKRTVKEVTLILNIEIDQASADYIKDEIKSTLNLTSCDS